MRCKKYLKKNFLQCLVSEIELFVYIFGQKLNGRKRSEKEKGRPSSFLLFPTHKYLLQSHKVSSQSN